MELITGPQSTPQQCERLVRVARALGIAHSAPDVDWADVSSVTCLPGWETCDLAQADVLVAESLSLPVTCVEPAAALRSVS